jgi:hypothetical protein
MAGRPEMQRRLARMSDDAETILEWFEQGVPMDRIAMRLTDKYEENISSRLVSMWANSEKYAPLVGQARARAADHLAESNLSRAADLTDRVKVGIADRDDIAAERHLADQSKWLAGVWNKDKYAPQTGSNVTVNVGEIHLNSLRSQPAVAAARPASLLRELGEDAEDVEPVDVPQTLADLL